MGASEAGQVQGAAAQISAAIELLKSAAGVLQTSTDPGAQGAAGVFMGAFDALGNGLADLVRFAEAAAEQMP